MADKTANIFYANGSKSQVVDWAHLHVESTYVMFIFKPGNSMIIPYNNLLYIEVIT